MHYVSIGWDDGLSISNLKVADIYEKHGLRAEFNVVVVPIDDSGTFGDFGLWNEIQARGHRIEPHGYWHNHLGSIPFADAQEQIQRCLDEFADNLQCFTALESIFCFPYNNSSPEIDAWMPSQVRAFRTDGPGINPPPKAGTARLTSTSADDNGTSLSELIAELNAQPEGWLIYCAHGLDGEGWGPVSSDFLDRTLSKLREQDDLVIAPIASVLDMVK